MRSLYRSSSERARAGEGRPATAAVQGSATPPPKDHPPACTPVKNAGLLQMGRRQGGTTTAAFLAGAPSSRQQTALRVAVRDTPYLVVRATGSCMLYISLVKGRGWSTHTTD